MGWRALEHHLAAFPSGTRADVHDVVGTEHHVLIVLHHDDGIAQVTQVFQRFDQALVVALVEADARLVEDIQHIDQLRTNLGSQSDALAFTAGETGRLSVEGQIVEPHLEQEVEARAYLLQYLAGYLLLLVVQVFFHFVEPFPQFGNVHRGQF